MRVITIAFTTMLNNIPGYVEHSDLPTHADDLAEQAGRLCYESWDRPHAKTATNDGYLANIIQQKHFSVLEHATATFYIDGVTRNATHELIRHRHMSYSEVSQRYVDVGEFEFVEHPGLAEIHDDTRKLLNSALGETRKAYKAVMTDLTDAGKERKKARQAARHALMSGTETKILVSGNLRAWRELLEKRLSPQADEEFRQLAQVLLTELKRMAPGIFQDFEEVPSDDI